MTKITGVSTRPPKPFSAEVRDRAVRLVAEQQPAHATQWAAIRSIAEKIGCSPETVRRWVRRAERDAGQRPGVTTITLPSAPGVSTIDVDVQVVAGDCKAPDGWSRVLTVIVANPYAALATMRLIAEPQAVETRSTTITAYYAVGGDPWRRTCGTASRDRRQRDARGPVMLCATQPLPLSSAVWCHLNQIIPSSAGD